MKYHPLARVALILLLVGCGQEQPAAPAPLPPPPPALPAVGATPAGDSVAKALAGFEGEIGLLAHSAGSSKPAQAIAVSIKGTRLRFSLPEGIESSRQLGQRVHVIVNTADKKLMAVIDDKQQVFVVNLEQLGEQLKGFAPPSVQGKRDEQAPPQLKKTGRSASIAGYPCEDWELSTTKGERALICVANQGAAWFQLPASGLPAEHAWARELFDGQHLPLRVVTFDDKGAEATRIEVTKLDRRAVPDAVFEAPAAYKTVDIAEMMRGLGSLGMPRPGMAGPDGKGKAMPADMQKMMEQMRARMQAAKASRPPTK